MYSYALLEAGCYYLIQEKENDPIITIRISVETDYCVFITEYLEVPTMEWKKKTAPIHDILECLSDDKAREWFRLYNETQDAYHEEDDES